MSDYQKRVKEKFEVAISKLQAEIRAYENNWSYELKYSKDRKEELEAMYNQLSLLAYRYDGRHYMNFA